MPACLGSSSGSITTEYARDGLGSPCGVKRATERIIASVAHQRQKAIRTFAEVDGMACQKHIHIRRDMRFAPRGLSEQDAPRRPQLRRGSTHRQDDVDCGIFDGRLRSQKKLAGRRGESHRFQPGFAPLREQRRRITPMWALSPKRSRPAVTSATACALKSSDQRRT